MWEWLYQFICFVLRIIWLQPLFVLLFHIDCRSFCECIKQSKMWAALVQLFKLTKGTSSELQFKLMTGPLLVASNVVKLTTMLMTLVSTSWLKKLVKKINFQTSYLYLNSNQLYMCMFTRFWKLLLKTAISPYYIEKT